MTQPASKRLMTEADFFDPGSPAGAQIAAAVVENVDEYLEGGVPELSLYDGGARPASVLDQDPHNNARVTVNTGGNAFTIRNINGDVSACSAAIFVDGTASNDGQGVERGAIGYSNHPDNGIFGESLYFEVSNDPAPWDGTKPPTRLVFVQTGVIQGMYRNRLWQELKPNGDLIFYNYDNGPILKLPANGPTVHTGDIHFTANLAVGGDFVPDFRLDVKGPTGQGMRFADTTLGDVLFFTMEAQYYQWNLSGKGMKFIVDGGEALRLEGAKVGFYGVAAIARQGLHANATDLASVIALANDTKAKLTALGLVS